ncbi:DNA alkylation repair protein [Chloroflexota bacterium]
MIDQSSNPDSFCKSLDFLLQQYRNFTLRNEKKYFGLDLPSYNTPSQVLSSITKELGKNVSTNPEIGLALATRLWNEDYLEAKLLATSLFGSLPTDTAISLLTDFPKIAAGIQDNFGFLHLLTDALIKIRIDYPAQFNELITSWMGSPDTRYQSIGLKIITNMITDSGNEDLPTLFEVIDPLLKLKDPSSNSDLIKCIDSIYTCSPSETVHYLVEAINEINDTDGFKNFSRFVRKLSSDLQKEINPIIKTKSSSLRL